MNPMVEKLGGLVPEIILLIGAVACLFLGLMRTAGARRVTPLVAGLALVASILIPSLWHTLAGEGNAAADEQATGIIALLHMGLADTAFATYVKLIVAAIGLMLLLVAVRAPEQLPQTEETESGRAPFDPANTARGEFYAFFLLSLTGVMLCASADSLIWLLLALELTSLPTYIMVVTTRDRAAAQEAAVKYFFLGAMAVAMFLYGFALMYGAAGTVQIYAPAHAPDAPSIHGTISALRMAGEPLPPEMLVGLILAVVGISFKIAAVPMHFYTADVYQGATTPVTAFLAFVPKTAGFVALTILLAAVGWPLPPALAILLWVMAVLTMTVGNVLGLVQNSVKRALAYSSIAHSGYMLIGLIVGMSLVAANGGAGGGGGGGEDGLVLVEITALQNGLAGVLFYLVAYGVGNLAAFGVLACLRSRGEEADTYEDISGLRHRDAPLAAVLLVAMISLIGLPPLVGFIGKLYLFAPAFSTGEVALVWLVVIALLNSAISAVYYLRIAAAAFFGEPEAPIEIAPSAARRTGTTLAGVLTIIFGLFAGAFGLTTLANRAVDLPITLWPQATEQVEDADAEGQ